MLFEQVQNLGCVFGAGTVVKCEVDDFAVFFVLLLGLATGFAAVADVVAVGLRVSFGAAWLVVAVPMLATTNPVIAAAVITLRRPPDVRMFRTIYPSSVWDKWSSLSTQARGVLCGTSVMNASLWGEWGDEKGPHVQGVSHLTHNPLPIRSMDSAFSFCGSFCLFFRYVLLGRWGGSMGVWACWLPNALSMWRFSRACVFVGCRSSGSGGVVAASRGCAGSVVDSRWVDVSVCC